MKRAHEDSEDKKVFEDMLREHWITMVHMMILTAIIMLCGIGSHIFFPSIVPLQDLILSGLVLAFLVVLRVASYYLLRSSIRSGCYGHTASDARDITEYLQRKKRSAV